MDLTSRIRTHADLEEAKALIVGERFFYQPFRIAADLEVGGGYEFMRRRPGAGMVYWPAYERERERFPGPAVKTVDAAVVPQFTAANEALRKVYEGFVDQICERVGDIRSKSVADVGCSNGYMPVSFALRGARRAVGYDQNDHSGCFRFLNRLLGADAHFVHARYDLLEGRMPRCPVYDVVVSMSVLQHMTEPLRHLHFLRSVTGQALFLMTNVWDDEDYVLRYGEPNATSNYAFPWCFDNSVYASERLLRKALDKAGFGPVVELEFRLPAGTVHAEARGSHDYADAGEHRQKLVGKALLCFACAETQVSLAAACFRPGSNRVLALLRRLFPRLSWWFVRRILRWYP